MSAQHTPTPWRHDTHGYPHPDIKAASGRNVACTWGVNNQPKTSEGAEHQKQIARANARRIVACVNACAGISTDELESIATTGGMLGPREDVARIAAQRDELLAALKQMLETWEHGGVSPYPISAARAAIAKVEGT